MEVLYPRCAGLDVHAKTVVACVRIALGATVTYQHRTVSTNTRGLLELADWLTAQAVTHGAMEATGVYWKPVWHVLEGHATLILANAMHIRNIPGRKSDTNDATWISDLLALGLIRSSFVPPIFPSLNSVTVTSASSPRVRLAEPSLPYSSMAGRR